MTTFEKFVNTLLKPINPSMIIILGVYTFVWGFWIFNPWWTVFTQAPLFSAMASIAGEWLWGSIAMAAGLVISYGAIKPSYTNLHFGCFVATMHWFIISLMYFMGDWTNTGGITALVFAIYASVIWVNVKINRQVYEKE